MQIHWKVIPQLNPFNSKCLVPSLHMVPLGLYKVLYPRGAWLSCWVMEGDVITDVTMSCPTSSFQDQVQGLEVAVELGWEQWRDGSTGVMERERPPCLACAGAFRPRYSKLECSRLKVTNAWIAVTRSLPRRRWGKSLLKSDTPLTYG